MSKERTIKITVEVDGENVYRNYGEKKLEEWCDIGLEVIDMVKSIDNSYRHKF